MPSQKVASAYVDLQLQTAAFKAAINEASGEMKKFGAQMREESQKSRESVKLLSEELGLGIPRGLQGIISKLPGVTAAMNLAFDSVVVFALIGTIVHVTEKIGEFAKKNEEAAAKHKKLWGDISRDVQDTNDQLAVSNLKLEDANRKLEHKPEQNGIKIALEEAIVSADNLGEKLSGIIEKIETAFKGEQADSLFAKFVGMDGDQSGVSTQAKGYKDTILDIKGNASLTGDQRTQQMVDEAHRQVVEADKRIAALQTQVDNTNKLGLSQNGMTLQSLDLWKDYRRHVAPLAVFADQSQTHQGLQGQNAIDSRNAANDAKDKQEAEARKKLFEETFAADYAHRLPNAASIMANPGTPGHPGAMAQWESGRDKAEYTAIIRQLQDGEKNHLKAQDIAMFKVLLLAIGTKLDIQTAMDTQKVASADQTAITEYTKSIQEMDKRADSSLIESQKSLTDALKSASDSYTEASVKYILAQDKEALRQGKITESQFESEHRKALAVNYTQQFQDVEIKSAATEKALLKKHDDLKQGYIDAYSKAVPNFKDARGTGGDWDRASVALDKAIKELDANLMEELSQADKAKNDSHAAAQVNLTGGYYESMLAEKHSQALGGIQDVFDEFIARSRNAGKQIHDILSDVLNSFNDAAIKALTTKDHRGVWKDMGKSIFSGAAKTGLQDAEGYAMGAAEKIPGIGGLISKLHPKKVQEIKGHVIVDSMPGTSGSLSGAALTATGVANAASSSGGIFAGIFKGAAAFAGAMAGGGVMTPGGFYLTGEQGPELLQVGSTSRINNARDTSAILKGGSGGDTHHWNIDARGSNDPAAVRRQVMQGIKDAAPHIIAAGHAAQTAQQRSKPTTQR